MARPRSRSPRKGLKAGGSYRDASTGAVMAGNIEGHAERTESQGQKQATRREEALHRIGSDDRAPQAYNYLGNSVMGQAEGLLPFVSSFAGGAFLNPDRNASRQCPAELDFPVAIWAKNGGVLLIHKDRRIHIEAAPTVCEDLIRGLGAWVSSTKPGLEIGPFTVWEPAQAFGRYSGGSLSSRPASGHVRAFQPPAHPPPPVGLLGQLSSVRSQKPPWRQS